MRISAAHGDGYLYRVYDHRAWAFRHDLCWVEDEGARLGVGYAYGNVEVTERIEQRERIVIIQALRWVAVDLPLNEDYASTRESTQRPVVEPM